MSWAGRRRLIIAIIVGAVVTASIAIVLIATLYETPTCTDGVQNQDESGIDCGGSCAYRCTADFLSPTVLFTEALTNSAGRTDILALIENKNKTVAAKNVSYSVRMYGKGQILLQEVTGTADLPPGATIPVFIPGAMSGKQTIVNKFLTIATSSLLWFATDTSVRIVPTVSNIRQGGSTDAPRIDATLSNASVAALTNVKVIVIVRDIQKAIIAASQTIVPLIEGQGTANAVFTWNSAFPNAPASIEVIPIIPLP